MNLLGWFKTACGMGGKEEAKPQTLLQKMSIDDVERLRAVVCARWQTDPNTQRRYVEMDFAGTLSFQMQILGLKAPEETESGERPVLGIPIKIVPEEGKFRIILEPDGEEVMKRHEVVWEALRSEAIGVVARMPVGEPITVQNSAAKFRGASGQQILYPLKLEEMSPGKAFLVPKALCALGMDVYRLPESEESGASFAIASMGAMMVGQYRKELGFSAGDQPRPAGY